MSCPLFVLVTEDGSEFLMLKDDNGVGNAIPTQQGFRDLDIRQDYVTGDTGKNPVRLPHELILSMDYVTQEIREKLLDWKFRRVQVTLSDSLLYGPDTVFAYRPIEMTGGGYSDLTGNYTMAAVGDSQYFAPWNELTREMEAPRIDNQAIIIDTEFGKAFRGTRKAMNHAPNPYPESVTSGFGPGLSGWKWGDPSGIGTLGYDAAGFDNALCPGVLTIETDGNAGNIQIWSSDYFDPGSGDYGGWLPPASSTLWTSIWVKGQFPTGSVFTTGPTGAEESVDISTLDTSEWTKVTLGKYEAGSFADFNVRLNCECSAGEFCNFQVGPIVMSVEDDTEPGSSFGGPGDWTSQQNGATGATTVPNYINVGAFSPPNAGAITMLYSIDDGLFMNKPIEAGAKIGLWKAEGLGSGTWDGMVIAQQRNNRWAVRVIVGGGENEYFECEKEVLWSPGLHALSIVYGNGPVRCFVDGQELAPENGSLTYVLTDGDLFFNGLSFGPHTGCAVRYHGMNVVAGNLSEGEVSGLHGALTDTVARSLIDTCRARLYEIVSVPAVPLIQDGFTRWIGDLRLRQVMYTGDDPAWFAEDI